MHGIVILEEIITEKVEDHYELTVDNKYSNWYSIRATAYDLEDRSNNDDIEIKCFSFNNHVKINRNFPISLFLGKFDIFEILKFFFI